MAKILVMPGKYVQGKGTINNLSSYLEPFADNYLIICDSFVLKKLKRKVEDGLKNKKFILEEFKGESSKIEIKRLEKIAKTKKVQLIVGIGGGKTLDTAKAVSYYCQLPVAIIPTIASTDAPCSALSVIYTPEGKFEEYLFLPKNPDLVLVDTEIIAHAPVRFLVAGIGDALATHFEAEACSLTKATNIASGTQTQSALELAHLCFHTLLEYSMAAIEAAQANVVTEALEKIVEANTLLSGLGFESGGLAAAHAIHNGLTVLDSTHDKYHGEKVAFATIVQLILEDRPPGLIEEVITFCQTVGLPTTLSDLGIREINKEEILKVAKTSTAESETIHNMPFPINEDMVQDAILAADRLGR